jgi:hypothetical protein
MQSVRASFEALREAHKALEVRESAMSEPNQCPKCDELRAELISLRKEREALQARLDEVS